VVIKIKEDDNLVWVKTTSWNDNIFIVTREWKAIQFKENDVRPMWRTASWVRWIKIKWNDEVVEVAIVWKDEKYVLIVTQNGMWKISEITEYRDQTRGWSWVKVMAITVKTWYVVWVMMLKEEDIVSNDLLLMSKWWQTIRLPLKWIRITSRVTQWVILTKIRSENDEIVRASLIKSWEWEKNSD
jgi:DNA gyrase subunit A